MCVCSVAQYGSGNRITTFSKTPKPSRSIADDIPAGNAGAKAIVRAFSAPSGTVTTACEPRKVTARPDAPTAWTVTPPASAATPVTCKPKRTSAPPASESTIRM